MFHRPRECVLVWPFIFFPHFLQVVTMAFVISLEKLKDMRILAPSIEKDRQKWLAYWEQPALCDEESVRFTEDLKTMMRTRALSKWVLMKSRLQENTFLCVLHSFCLVQVCRGGKINLNPYLVVTAVLIVNSWKERWTRRTDKKFQVKENWLCYYCHQTQQTLLLLCT